MNFGEARQLRQKARPLGSSEDDLGRTPAAVADEIQRHAKPIMQTTREAVSSWGAFAGCNDAIGMFASEKQTVDGLLDTYGLNALHMACIRVSALFDRDGKVGFQRIYRRLQVPGVIEILSERATDWPLRRGPTQIPIIVREFEDVYRAVDWSRQGALQALRNVKLAHITEEDLKKKISLEDFETLTFAAAQLCFHTLLISDGMHHDFVMEAKRIRKQACEFWSNVLAKTYGYRASSSTA